tara:strand:- start:19163 stop:19933 length:771 start_codon:yes stop_codon:yes gene_type:complete
MRNIIAIIPARMNSSRFPGKPMAKILGIPMIGHCYFRTRMCEHISETYVATCDEEIHEYIKSVGGKSIMTSEGHQRASDRVAEAMLKIEEDSKLQTDIVVMVQGDEPMITPRMISASVKPFHELDGIEVVNLMARIDNIEDFEDPNEVKVVVDRNNHAIYFSREPIPSRKKGFDNVPMYKQVCIIPFTREGLLRFNETPETELEKIESVDMLRFIENNIPVYMVKISEKTFSVDTEKDRLKVEELMKADDLIDTYK